MSNEFIVKNGLIVGGNVVTSGTITINGALAATQSWVTSQSYLTSASLSGYATQSYVTSAISALIDAAPAALDTLNELAAALGDDASFSTTVTNSIAGKVAKSGDTMTGSLTFASTADNVRLQKNSSFLNLRDPWNNIHLYNAGDGTYIDATVHFWRSQAGTHWVALNSTGLGIGTTSPNSVLDIRRDGGSSTNPIPLTSWYGGNGGGNLVAKLEYTADAGIFTIGYAGLASWDSIVLDGGNSNGGSSIALKNDTVTTVFLRSSSGNNYINSGSLGIGTTTPYAGTNVTSLDINATAYPVLALSIGSSYVGGMTGFSNHVAVSAKSGNYITLEPNDTEAVRITNAGRVGIGTTSPAKTLVVNGETWINLTSDYFGGGTTVQISSGGTGAVGIQSNTFYLYPYSSDTATNLIYGYNGTASWNLNNGGNNRFNFYSYGGGITVMSLTSGGKVGIGTTSPAGKLSIEGDGTEYSNIVFKQSAAQEHLIYASLNYQYNLIGSGSPVWIWGQQGGSERMRLDNTNLGIGTTSPSQKLHIYGSGDQALFVENSSTYHIYTGLSSNVGYVGSNNATPLSLRTNGNSRLYIDTSGNVGIGTTSPSYKLDVSGTARFTQSITLNQSAVVKKRFDSGTNNPVKTASGVLTSRSDNASGSTYYVIETNVPQDEYQMGGFTIELFGNYSSTNHKTKIDLGGYWNPEGNGGFIGFEAHGSNPQYKPTIEVARNTSTGNTAFIIYGLSWNYPVIVARDLWLGYNGTDGGAYGEGWSIIGTETISGYSNRDTVVWRNAYSDSNPAGYITGYTETDTLQSVTSRGATTNTLVSLNAGLRMGNAYLTPSGDQNHFHFDGTAIIPNSSTTANNASIGTNTYRWSSVYGGYGYFSENVGIGTTSPNKQLTFTQANDDAIQIRRLTTSQGNTSLGTGISWTWTSAGTDNETWAAIRVIMPGNGNSIMTFSTTPDGGGGAGLTERMRINSAGKVSIGTTSTNSDKSDFTVYTGGTTTLALSGGEFRVGETDVNWNVALRQSGVLETYGQNLYLGSAAGNYPVIINPNGTNSVSFYQTESYLNTYTRINYNWGGGAYGTEAFTIRGTYPSIALRSTTHDSKWLIHHASELQFYYGTSVDTNSWSNAFSIPTNGDIYMSWAGANISTLLNAKQNASTAITTSNIGSQSVSYATSSGSSGYASYTPRVAIEDTRSGQRTPNDYDDYRASWEFTNQIPGLSGSSWWSLMTLQGWHNAYAAWQIIGPSDAGPENWYLRVGNNTTWGTARRIWHDGDFTSTNISNWNTAYGWGNHASAGYLTSYSETDTLASVTNRGNSTTNRINVRGIGNQSGGNIMMGDVGEGTNKWSYLTGTHYNASSQPQGFALIGGLSTDSFNAVVIGGNIYETNPATEIQFWTHSATTHNLGGTQRGVINSAGNWGIGTTSPYSLLQVGNPEQTTPAELTIASRYDGGGPILNFRTDHPDNNNQWNMARIVATDDGNYNGRIEFRTTDSSGYTGVQPTTKMLIKASGNVGIGIGSPSEKLHVSGAAIFDGGAGNSSTDSVVYITKSTNDDWGLYVNNAGLDYGMYTRTSPSANYAFAIHNGTTWTTRITGNAIIYLGEKDAIRGNSDSWLRLNNSNDYTSGVYTPGIMRADGGFNVSGNTVWHAANDGSGSGLDADLLDGQDSSVFLRLLPGGAEASLDSYTDNGVRSVSFAGHSQHLLSWNAGGSTGTVQQLFHYGTPNNGWRIRNKTDNSSWSDWGYVVMASSNQGLISGTIATQSWVGSQSYATTSYVTTQINNLINGAPGALDTLSELASALGNDASFATTVTNSIAGKVSKSGDTMTSSAQQVLNVYHGAATGDFNDALFLKSIASGQQVQIGMATLDADGDHHRVSLRAYKGTQTLEGVFGIALRQPSAAHIQRFTLDYLGNVTIGGFLTESSSLKLKENVETSEGNLEKVVNLRPVTYNKIGSQTTELGLIAEEVAEVYPEFVQYDENGEPIGVNYSRLTAALIGAVKELTNQVQELNKKING